MANVTVDNGGLTDYDVTMGAGAVDASKTQRVTLASDDPAVSSLAAIEAAVGGGLTDAELRATPVPVDGSGVTQPVSGTFWQATQPVSGTVTANAGTNLNTSALALETGGNLAGAATSLAVMDDWDESDRAKVNPIVGQAGVQGGSGSVSATTQRVVLATDVALPAGTNAIGKLAANSGVDIGDVDVTSLPALAAGTNNIGDVDVLTVPADPFGANADAAVAAGAAGSIQAKLRRATQGLEDLKSLIVLAAGTNNIGDVDVLTVPTDPFGANADAASATGSISAKLRAIATALGVTALDLGSGTGGSRTLRLFQDTAQWVGGSGTDSSAVQRVSLATNVALPAGTNGIGKLTANSGVDIGDVDVTSIIPGTGATNLGKAEDTAAGAGDTCVPVLFRRNDDDSSDSDSDDYAVPSVDSGGNVNTRPRPAIVRVQVTSGGLTTASTAYSAGDTVGNQFTFAGCARASGGAGYITGVVIHDETDVVGPLDLFVFDSSVTPAADNAANAWSDSDMQKLVDIIPLAVVDSGNNRVCNSGPIRVPYVCSGGTSLYGCIVTRSGHTFFGATTSIKAVIYVEPS